MQSCDMSVCLDVSVCLPVYAYTPARMYAWLHVQDWRPPCLHMAVMITLFVQDIRALVVLGVS
jgi:hypothetical protein